MKPTQPISNTEGLKGWRFLVTGASRGLGRGLTKTLLDQGATVLAFARSDQDLSSLRGEHQQASDSHRLLTCSGSILNKEALDQAICTLQTRAGGCDVLIANAGVYGPRQSFDQSPATDWEDAFHVNTIGLVRTIRACIPVLAESGRGHILVVGSAIGHSYASNSSAYAASKAMGWSLVKCLSIDLESLGIAVNELIPGPVLTAMNPYASQQVNCRKPDDLAFSQLIRFLCTDTTRPPSGQSYSLRYLP